MRTIGVAGVLAVGLAGGGSPGDRVAAVTRTYDWESGKLVERRYVDGVAIRAAEGSVALLSQAPLDECLRLAVVAENSIHVDAFSAAGMPVLAIVRSEEYPTGSVQMIEPGSTSILADSMPALQEGGERLVAQGRSEPESSGSDSDEPALEYDVDLGFVSMGAYDPLAADSSPEAAWLRRLRAVPDGEREAAVDASFLTDEEDWNSTVSRQAWAMILAGWSDVSVVAAASGPDCATLVLRAPGFASGELRAIVRAVGTGDERRVFAVEADEEYYGDRGYVVGRVEHPGFGAFPILHARASVADSGPVVVFSDRPLGDAGWEELATRQRVVRAIVTMSFGNSFNFGSFEIAGPGAGPVTLAATSLINAHLDETTIAALIKQEAGETRLVINFRLPLSGAAVGP